MLCVCVCCVCVVCMFVCVLCVCVCCVYVCCVCVSCVCVCVCVVCACVCVCGAEICVFADIVEHFSKSEEYVELEDGTGLQSPKTLLTFRSIFHDVRNAMEHIHSRVCRVCFRVLVGVCAFVWGGCR